MAIDISRTPDTLIRLASLHLRPFGLPPYPPRISLYALETAARLLKEAEADFNAVEGWSTARAAREARAANWLAAEDMVRNGRKRGLDAKSPALLRSYVNRAVRRLSELGITEADLMAMVERKRKR